MISYTHRLRDDLLAYGWQQNAPWPIENGSATSAQVASASVGGQNLPDTVDLFVWAGHSWLAADPGAGSGTADGGGCLHFISQHAKVNDPNPATRCGCPVPAGRARCYGKPCGNINHSEVELGADDNEVSIFYTCDFLKNRNRSYLYNKIRDMHHGNHLMLGFAGLAAATVPQVFADNFAYAAMGKVSPPVNPQVIWQAWIYSALNGGQPNDPSIILRVHYWDQDQTATCLGDYLQGNVKGWGYGAQPPVFDPAATNHGDFKSVTYYPFTVPPQIWWNTDSEFY